MSKFAVLVCFLIVGCVHQEPLVKPPPLPRRPEPIPVNPEPVEPKAPAPSHDFPKVIEPKVEMKEAPIAEQVMKRPSEVNGVELERTRLFPRY